MKAVPAANQAANNQDSFSEPRRELGQRFTLAGALIGVLVGLFEAALLSSTPRYPPLLEPDVRVVIWFLAPPIPLVLFTLLGMAMGWMAARGNSVSPQRNATLVAALVGVAGAYVASALSFVTLRAADIADPENLQVPLLWFFVVFAYALFTIQVAWRHVACHFTLDTRWPKRALGLALAAMAGLYVLGCGIYFIKRSFSLTPAKARASAPPQRPNIVLITLDTVRADHLSSYGYPRPTTPNLDRLAARGVLFEDAVAPTPWTLATHASIFTGLLPHQHGADWAVPLDSAPWTLAEVLESQGYETAGFSANLYYGQSGWGMAQGFETYEDDSASLRHNLAATLLGHAVVQPLYQHVVQYDLFNRRNAAEVNQDVFRWFHRRSSRPFFLFINYFDCHDPYLAPPPYRGRFGQLKEDVVRSVNTIDGIGMHKSLSREDQDSFVAGYDNSLAFLDDQVSQLMRVLAVSPDWANTVVIITSDHGEGFGEHTRYGHGWNIYREVLHVPLIIFGSGIPKGLRVRNLVRIRELFPTVIDLALGGQPPFRRTSLRRFWTPGFQPEPFDEAVVSQLIPNLYGPERTAYIALTTSEWYYLQDSSGRAELYHRPTDPQERMNLIHSVEHRQTVELLSRRLRETAGISFRPWRGPEYLSALDEPGRIFLKEIAFDPKWQSPPSPEQLRIGLSQAFFAPGQPSQRKRSKPTDEELLRSLPYH